MVSSLIIVVILKSVWLKMIAKEHSLTHLLSVVELKNHD